MRPFKSIVLTLFITFVFVACTDDNPKKEGVLIRVSNISAYNYKNITVNSTRFEDINSGNISEYKLFDQAYRYGFIELEIHGATYTIQPIDYVGETPLENGIYTYQIDANDSQEQYGKLSLTFVED